MQKRRSTAGPCRLPGALYLLATAGLAVGAAIAGQGRGPGKVERARFPAKQVDDATLEELIRSHHTETEKVRLVMLPASVEDPRGRIVKGLKREDFRLFEDLVPQEIEHFSVETSRPIALAFLLDLSGSMRQLGKLERAKEAIRSFADRLGPRDRLGLIGFADEQIAWITDFTTDRERFLERVSVQRAFGKTAVNDAVAAAPSLVDEKIEGKKAIVLITDGVDNSSRLSAFDAVRSARRVNVPLYTIGFSSLPQEALPDGETAMELRVLRLFSNETGGALLVVRDRDDLGEAVSRVIEELRYQYLIGYLPTRTRWDGTFRRIRLETTRDQLVVRTRRGYYATP